jgi:HEPN domain-containing protein
MPCSPDQIQEAKRWLRFADDDFASSKLHLATTLILPNQSCYHAQQAVEKALKALLLIRSRSFPRTHDLTSLVQLLPTLDIQRLSGIDLAELTAWSVTTRYPSDFPEATQEMAQRAILQASTIMELIHQVFEEIK